MKRKILILVALAVPLACAASDKKKDLSPKEQAAARIEQMKEKIAHDSPREICYHSAELVRELVEEFNLQMSAGELKPAQQTLNDIGAYAQKAGFASLNSRHKLKQAELILHDASRRMRDIEETLSVEDRPAMEAEIKKIDAADDTVLKQVFKE